jgi:hypothetical protein
LVCFVCLVYSVYSVCSVYGRLPGDLASVGCLPLPSVGLICATP